MSSDKNHSEAFEKYLKDELPPEQANAFERKVLNDAFTQEALEGFEEQGIERLNDVSKLKERIINHDKKEIAWWKYAGVAAIVLISFYFIFISLDQFDQDSQLASDDALEENGFSEVPKPDTIPLPKQAVVSEQEELIEESDNNETQEVVAEEITENSLAANDEDDIFFESNNDEREPTPISLNEFNDAIVGAEIDEAQKADLQPLETKSEIESTQLGASEVAIVEDEIEVSEISAARALQGQIAGVQVEETKSKKLSKGAVERSAAFINSNLVSGVVTNSDREPIPGVNVIVKGTTRGTQTDLDGKFQLEVEDDPTLVFAFVGFDSKEIDISGKDSIEVILSPNIAALQEVVVTGYGITDPNESSYSPASPQEGKKAYKTYLEENLVYPKSARDNKIEGTVVLQFTISPTGSIENIDVKKSLGYGCDEEAIRLVEEGPKWDPASRDGSNVDDEIKVRVRFKIE